MKTEKFKLKNGEEIEVVDSESMTDKDWGLFENCYNFGYLQALADMEEAMGHEYYWEIAPDVKANIEELRRKNR